MKNHPWEIKYDEDSTCDNESETGEMQHQEQSMDGWRNQPLTLLGAKRASTEEILPHALYIQYNASSVWLAAGWVQFCLDIVRPSGCFCVYLNFIFFIVVGFLRILPSYVLPRLLKSSLGYIVKTEKLISVGLVEVAYTCILWLLLVIAAPVVQDKLFFGLLYLLMNLG